MNKFIQVLQHMRSTQSINLSLSRGAASSALRVVEKNDPASWEFSGFSQNGEDGILDFLTRAVRQPNRYFIEIGASNGLENNTTWLAMVRRFGGLWIEGDEQSAAWCKYLFTPLNYGLEMRSLFVTKATVAQVREAALYHDPDVFSLDIDGNDYYVAEAMFEAGFRPKICVMEYNSTFGPEQALTIPYQDEFRLTKGEGDNLYYGCSVAGWEKFFCARGYQFVTVDTNGVNAFFIDPTAFDANFTKELKSLHFAENFSQAREYKVDWTKQWPLIQKREFVSIA